MELDVAADDLGEGMERGGVGGTVCDGEDDVAALAQRGLVVFDDDLCSGDEFAGQLAGVRGGMRADGDDEASVRTSAASRMGSDAVVVVMMSSAPAVADWASADPAACQVRPSPGSVRLIKVVRTGRTPARVSRSVAA